MLFIPDPSSLHTPLPAIGGKARNLLALAQPGLNIPKWVALPADVLTGISGSGAAAHAAEALQAIDRYEFTTGFLAQLQRLFAGTAYLAVRSSAIDEDGRLHSFAGQFESYLYVRPADVADKIKDVWRSAFSERVQAYRWANRLGPNPGIAVIIQEMVDADTSGVAFGMNPVNGSRKEKLISGVYGVGEGLVSGNLNADNYTINEGVIDRRTVRKTHKIILNPDGNGGTATVPVLEGQQNRPAIPDDILHQLDGVLDKLRNTSGLYQDVEFAVKDGTLYILQARPITGLAQLADPTGEHVVWDNSNIVESYPGVTTPLTFSFISASYSAAYKLFLSFLGVDDATIHRHRRVLDNMLGFINGRVYYNLRSWYHLLALLPGYSLNARFMEQMMGVKERFDVPAAYRITKGKAWMRIAKMVLKMAHRFHTLPRRRAAFKKLLDSTINSYKALDLQTKDANELMMLYLRFEQTLLNRWEAPLLNDFFAMIAFGMLRKQCGKHTRGEHPNIHNDLLCGSADIISTQPIHRSVAIATYIAGVPSLKLRFEQDSPEALWHFLQHDRQAESGHVRELVEQYIGDFGERCVGELKLETVSYTQEPHRFVQVLKSYVQAGITTAKTSGKMEEKLRNDATAVMKKALHGNPLKRWLFNRTLKHARDLVSARENLRYERTRAFGVVRELFTAIGKRFYEEDILTSARDIFLLTKEEIFAYIEGRSATTDLKALVALRKEEHKQFLQLPVPAERIETYGPVYRGNDFFRKRDTAMAGGDLQGVGCCPGRVRAKARVVQHPGEVGSLNGDILVTTSTDPGWVTLFPSAGAIIVERGSLLSHSAIVSREMGIPCIVGVDGLLARVRTGDWLEMDGSTGGINIIKATEGGPHHG